MDLKLLNECQQEAVTTTEGPVMVMAGAGSGKTKVLTFRVAYLINELGVSPYNILAVTFTNKAANEMKERIANLLDIETKYMWISTFHSFAVRFLRKEITVLSGYRSNFTIIDDDDSVKIVKQIMKDGNYFVGHKQALNYISLVKNEASLPELDPSDRQELDTIFTAYQDHLRTQNLLDFDDLILLTVQILKDFPTVQAKYQEHFQYVMVDEFQDTNPLQYKLINLLTNQQKNIFIVGDVNQSIYAFRGARVENVNQFNKLYQPKIIKLEQNYRSTKCILDIANDVISKNKSFVNMQLYTHSSNGKKAKYYQADSNYGELVYIIAEIKKLIKEGYHYRDMAILYRLNSLSLNFENEFIKAKIPYIIYGGVGYFERKEVKDIIAYLRLITNPSDDFSFERIINVPKRKIGDKALDSLKAIARERGISLYEALPYATGQLFYSFHLMIENLKEKVNTTNLDFFLAEVLNKTGYMDMLKNANEDDRIDNVLELKSIMKDVMESYEGDNQTKLQNFLMDLALKTNTDNVSESDDKVKLMNYHQAKGLEYPIVFMVAMEQGIFPAFRSIGDQKDLEEERRVCYVGITRAKELLYFTGAHVRRLYGSDTVSSPSEFLRSINSENLERSGYGVYDTRLTAMGKQAASDRQSVKPRVISSGKYQAGDKVMHKVFGKGMVVKAEGESITVAFSQQYGIKVLVANHPSITKL